VKSEKIVLIEPKNGIECVLKILPIQNSKFSLVLCPNTEAKGIIIGLHRSFAQLFLIFLILNTLLIPKIVTKITIITKIIKNRALFNDHNSSSAIFLLTPYTLVLAIFPIFLKYSPNLKS